MTLLQLLFSLFVLGILSEHCYFCKMFLDFIRWNDPYICGILASLKLIPESCHQRKEAIGNGSYQVQTSESSYFRNFTVNNTARQGEILPTVAIASFLFCSEAFNFQFDTRKILVIGSCYLLSLALFSTNRNTVHNNTTRSNLVPHWNVPTTDK